MSSGLPDALHRDLGGGGGLELLEAHADALGGGGGHVGDDEAGGDGVGGDAELAELLGEGLGEALETGLGGGVVDLAAVAERRGGGQVDDPAELGVHHVLLDRPCDIRNAPRRCTFMTVSQSDVAHLEEQVVAEHARVVDEDRGRAQLGGDPRDGGLDLGLVGDVAADGERLAAGGGDLLDGVLAGGLVEVESRRRRGPRPPVVRRWRRRCRAPRPVTMATRCSVVDMLVLLALGKPAAHGTPSGERPLSTFSRRDARSPGTRCQRPLPAPRVTADST